MLDYSACTFPSQFIIVITIIVRFIEYSKTTLSQNGEVSWYIFIV